MQKIATALVKAQKAFGPALKSSTNPHFKSKYADLAACIEAVIDALNDNGIALIQRQHPHEGGVAIETVFLHESGESYSAGTLTVPATKHDAQGYGSTLTYARRYSLMAACGIAPEDDDGNAARKPANDDGQPANAQRQDMSPKGRAQRIAAGVAAGDAAGAALAMSGWDKPLLDAVWAALDVATQEKLNKAWPEVTA